METQAAGLANIDGSGFLATVLGEYSYLGDVLTEYDEAVLASETDGPASPEELRPQIADDIPDSSRSMPTYLSPCPTDRNSFLADVLTEYDAAILLASRSVTSETNGEGLPMAFSRAHVMHTAEDLPDFDMFFKNDSLPSISDTTGPGGQGGHTRRGLDSPMDSLEVEERSMDQDQEERGSFVHQRAAPEWDVAHGHRRPSRLEKVSMLVPAVARTALNIVGGTIAGVSYGAGKLGEYTGGGKAVDSKAFRAGFSSWMWSNGIFPSVQYEPFNAAGRSIATLHSMPEEPKDTEIAVTPLLVANHVSYLDGVVLAGLFGAPKMVAEAGTRNTPVLGHLLEKVETVFVEEGQNDSHRVTQEAIRSHCASWAPGQRPMLIFPEGTTTNGESLAPFKKEAFDCRGAVVRPILIVYTGQCDPSKPAFKETEHGVEKLSDTEWAANFMGHFIHSMHVRVLAPYIPSDDEACDGHLYAANMREFMSKRLAQVREEVFQTSWKAASGRTDGAVGYQFGDFARVAVRRVSTKVAQWTQSVHGIGSAGTASPIGGSTVDSEDGSAGMAGLSAEWNLASV